MVTILLHYTLIIIVNVFVLIPSATKTISLSYGFKIITSTVTNNDDGYECKKIEIKHNNKTIVSDTSNCSYIFNDPLYPLIRETPNHGYQLLIEVDDRPSKNFALRFFINNDRVIKIDTLPTFIAPPKDIDGDGIKEYAGFWDYSQEWEKNSIMVGAYDPLLYYEDKSGGIVLDTLTTRKINTKIYGKFYGFNFDENIEIPVSKSDSLFNEAVKRIGGFKK